MVIQALAANVPSKAIVCLIDALGVDSCLTNDVIVKKAFDHILLVGSMRRAAFEEFLASSYQALTAIYYAVYLRRQDLAGLEAMFVRTTDMYLGSATFLADVSVFFHKLDTALAADELLHFQSRLLQVTSVVRRNLLAIWLRDSVTCLDAGTRTQVWRVRKITQEEKLAEAYRMGGWCFRQLAWEVCLAVLREADKNSKAKRKELEEFVPDDVMAMAMMKRGEKPLKKHVKLAIIKNRVAAMRKLAKGVLERGQPLPLLLPFTFSPFLCICPEDAYALIHTHTHTFAHQTHRWQDQ